MRLCRVYGFRQLGRLRGEFTKRIPKPLLQPRALAPGHNKGQVKELLTKKPRFILGWTGVFDFFFPKRDKKIATHTCVWMAILWV